MVQQLAKHRRCLPSTFTLAAIDAATRQDAVNVGWVLRPEAMARRNILIIDEGRSVARPITNTRERFYVACRRLAEERPIGPPALETSRRHRDNLAHVLVTATTRGR
jgi:hypothetical protein